MRWQLPWLASLALALIGAGCPPPPRLTRQAGEVQGDQPVVAQGVELRVLANAWRGYPSWLPERFTPMWLYLVNRGSESFDITYAALSMVDEHFESHPAVPPTLVSRELLGAREGSAAVPVLAAAEENQAQPPPRPRVSAPEPLPPAASPAPPLPMGAVPPSTSVFYGLSPYEYATPGSTAALGSGRSPFGYQAPFSPFGPLGIGRNAQDIVAPALREGRLLPNTHAEGFVYFRADHSARRLELRLVARNEREGAAPLEVRVPFVAR